MTVDELAAALGVRVDRAAQWHPHIEKAMADCGIDTPIRQAMFLAQIGHESGHLRYVKEIWNPAQCPWQAKYEGRKDLGNTQPGDGERFMGRGLIQITGRANYRACGDALGLPLEEHPQMLEVPQFAAASAGWFWQANKLNRWADIGDFDGVSDVINRGRKTPQDGDANGYRERLALYHAAQQVLA